MPIWILLLVSLGSLIPVYRYTRPGRMEENAQSLVEPVEPAGKVLSWGRLRVTERFMVMLFCGYTGLFWIGCTHLFRKLTVISIIPESQREVLYHWVPHQIFWAVPAGLFALYYGLFFHESLWKAVYRKIKPEGIRIQPRQGRQSKGEFPFQAYTLVFFLPALILTMLGLDYSVRFSPSWISINPYWGWGARRYQYEDLIRVDYLEANQMPVFGWTIKDPRYRLVFIDGFHWTLPAKQDHMLLDAKSKEVQSFGQILKDRYAVGK